MPSLLRHELNAITQANNSTVLSSFFSTPLLFIPTTGCVPLGIFTGTVVSLIQGNPRWILSEDRFRNHIRFFIPVTNKQFRAELGLRSVLDYIECCVKCVCGNDRLSDSEVMVECQKILLKELNSISNKCLHSKRVQWIHGFYCPGSSQDPHPAILVSDPKSPELLCCNSDKCQRGCPFPLGNKNDLWLKVNSCIL